MSLGSGGVQEKPSKHKGLRYNRGKLRFDLVNPKAHEDMVKVLTAGANKYEDRNWEKGMSWTQTIASLKRHLNAIEKGEDYDEETGFLHISHLACNAHFLNSFYHIYPEGDDRPKYEKRIGLDIDEVVADFVSSYTNRYDIERTPQSWYFDEKMSERLEELSKDVGFWMNMRSLVEPERLKFQPICYITSRVIPSDITMKWLEENGFPLAPVITVKDSKDKLQVAKNYKLDIFVDDNYETFKYMNENGVFTYLMSQEHNEHYDVGHKRLHNLEDLSF